MVRFIEGIKDTRNEMVWLYIYDKWGKNIEKVANKTYIQ